MSNPAPAVRWNSETAALAGAAPRTLKGKALRELLKLQATIMRMSQEKETTPTAVAQLARSWDCLEERKRIMRGHGVPMPVPAANQPGKVKEKQPASEDAPVVLKIA